MYVYTHMTCILHVHVVLSYMYSTNSTLCIQCKTYCKNCSHWVFFREAQHCWHTSFGTWMSVGNWVCQYCYTLIRVANGTERISKSTTLTNLSEDFCWMLEKWVCLVHVQCTTHVYIHTRPSDFRWRFSSTNIIYLEKI